MTEAPLGLTAELTHRCPLHCPYCSNPLELLQRAAIDRLKGKMQVIYSLPTATRSIRSRACTAGVRAS